MARKKHGKKATGKAKESSGSPAAKDDLAIQNPSPTEDSSAALKHASPRTPKNKATSSLPWATATTPTASILTQKVVTPEILKGMDKDEATHIVSVAQNPRQPGDEEKAEEKKQVGLLEATFLSIKRSERVLEAQLSTVTEQIALLAAKWEEGKIDMPKNRYQDQRSRNLALQQQLMSRLALLWSKNAAFAGSWTSDMITEGVTRDTVEDWALIDSVLRLYPTVEGARKTVRPSRTEAQQLLFRKKLEASYGSADDNFDTSFAFCSITGRRMQNVVAAHLVNVNVGAKTAAALFGEGQEHIWAPSNGLLIDKSYEELLDGGKAIILPDPSAANELIFHLLTRDLGRVKHDWWSYDKLHGRRLTFLSSFRPSRRYLFFKATVTLLRRRRGEVDGHWNDLSELPTVGKTMWATPGPYLKNSILYRFAREVGCMTRADADLFWGVDTAAEFANLRLSFSDEHTAGRLALESSVGTIAEQSQDNDEDNEEEPKVNDDPFCD
ncbi:hypothetical protein SCUCBS95973_000009 [Sporothrix curviconia]|uniref:HNH nuclease domain-containing protein n=1 Tax=Sporothrix curviconia TaxID=1260050 RepID=A0ABP0AML2_9PEZI